MSGQKKPFQVPWNWRIATAARAGPASGSITRQNVVKKPAPSILAASSSSRGIDRKYWRSRKMLVAQIARTAMTPTYWPTPRVSPTAFRMR